MTALSEREVSRKGVGSGRVEMSSDMKTTDDSVRKVRKVCKIGIVIDRVYS